MYLAQRETFQKAKPYGLEHIKIELINQDLWNDYSFPLKNLVVNFGNFILENSNWDKIGEDIIKKSISTTSKTLFERQKDNRKPNPNCSTYVKSVHFASVRFDHSVCHG